MASILGKIIGCFIGAKIGGMNSLDSLIIGVGMIPRMELALIIATTAISQKIIEGEIAHQILIVTILMTIVTTLITPFLIKALFKINMKR
jgi:Kef-type K+ transport system membrane component KefB